jgi:Cu/Ag efflux pump CusA
MVLASQFNSFVHPLTIMTSLPLSLPAGLLVLVAFGMTINVIGMLMLFGIVKKNSICRSIIRIRCGIQGWSGMKRSSPAVTCGCGPS